MKPFAKWNLSKVQDALRNILNNGLVYSAFLRFAKSPIAYPTVQVSSDESEF